MVAYGAGMSYEIESTIILLYYYVKVRCADSYPNIVRLLSALRTGFHT